MILKVTKHAPHRWLSLNKSLGVVIRLWHQLRKVFFNKGEEFSLDHSSNRDGILQLYSLMEPVVAITRDGQHGSAPMTAEMHMALSRLKATTLSSDQPLKVGKERFICFRCSCSTAR